MQMIVQAVVVIIAFVGGGYLYNLIYKRNIYFGENAGTKKIVNYIMCVLGVGIVLVFIANKVGLWELPASEKKTSQQVQEQFHKEDARDLSEPSLSSDYDPMSSAENGYTDDLKEDSIESDSESMIGVTEEYIFFDSNRRFLTDSELAACDIDTLRVARNEIYARHGRCFNDEGLQEYFESTSWYDGTIAPENFDESILNKYEKRNIKKIKQYEIK